MVRCQLEKKEGKEQASMASSEEKMVYREGAAPRRRAYIFIDAHPLLPFESSRIVFLIP